MEADSILFWVSMKFFFPPMISACLCICRIRSVLPVAAKCLDKKIAPRHTPVHNQQQWKEACTPLMWVRELLLPVACQDDGIPVPTSEDAGVSVTASHPDTKVWFRCLFRTLLIFKLHPSNHKLFKAQLQMVRDVLLQAHGYSSILFYFLRPGSTCPPVLPPVL